jgi:uncharacterized protein
MRVQSEGRVRGIKQWIGPKSSDPKRRTFAVIMKSADVCNYACSYCYVENHCKTEIMPIETARGAIQRVLRYLGPGRKVNFIWHGGEPLFAGREFFCQVADYCDTFPCNTIENCIQTNGSLLDGQFLSFCRDRGFLISLSIDGPEELHDLNRLDSDGRGTFAGAMRAVTLAREAGLAPGCVCVLSRANIHHIADLHRFFSENRINVRINPVVRSGRAARSYNDLAITPTEYGRAMCELFDLWFEDEACIQIEPLATIVGNIVSPAVWGCDYHGRCLESIIAINPDGAVYPCGRFAGLEQFRLGSIHEERDLSTILSGPLFERLTARNPETVIGCRQCEFIEICNTGCMITAYMSRGNIFDPDYYCHGRRILFEHIAHALKRHLDEIAAAN